LNLYSLDISEAGQKIRIYMGPVQQISYKGKKTKTETETETETATHRYTVT